MIEILIGGMGFPTEVSINYDPHHIISNIRKANKNNPFEHHEVAGLLEATNWLELPQKKQGNDGVEEDATSPMQGNNSPPPGTSSLGPSAEKVTPLASVSKHTNKRNFSDVMDREEEDTAKTPKKQKLE